MNEVTIFMNQAIEKIYREHRQGLFSLALSITGSHHLAEDAVHNAFTRLFGKPSIGGNCSDLNSNGTDCVAYVFKTVRNSAIDTIRSKRRQSNLSESLFKEANLANMSTDSKHDTLIVQERTTILQKAIDELEEHEKEAVVLKAIAGLTFEQVGSITNISPKTIATRYRRALQKLETKLKGQL